jgi:hypothetical protein
VCVWCVCVYVGIGIDIDIGMVVVVVVDRHTLLLWQVQCVFMECVLCSLRSQACFSLPESK